MNYRLADDHIGELLATALEHASERASPSKSAEDHRS
jgi:hypothetical protein